MPIEHHADLVDFGETDTSELADGLEQSITRMQTGVVELDQRTVHETRRQTEHVVTIEAAERGDGLGGVESEPTAEHCETVQQDALVRLEQVVAPLHRGQQGLLTGQERRTAPAQQTEAVVETAGDAFDRHVAHPRRSQLDGQRDPVELLTDRRDMRRVVVRHHEVRPGAHRPIDEQPNRVERPETVDAGHLARSRPDHRRHPPGDLAGQVQRLAAGGQHPQWWATAQQRLHQQRRLIQKMLAVVDDHERLVVTKTTDERLEQRLTCGFLELEHLGKGAPDRVRRTKGGELDVPDPVAVTIGPVDDSLQREAGLPTPTRPGDRQQTGVLEQGMELRQFRLAPNEGRERHRDSVGDVHATPPSDRTRSDKGHATPLAKCRAQRATAMKAKLNQGHAEYRPTRPARGECVG